MTPESTHRSRLLERALGITGTPASNPLRFAADACVRPIVLVGTFSFVVNLLLLVSPIYMMQVYDRVLGSGSIETLVFLTLVALFSLGVLALFETVRGQMLLNIGEWAEAYLSRDLFKRMIANAVGPEGYQGDRLRDLTNVRSFLSSPALTAVLDAFWTPLFIVVVFLLHPLLGVVALLSAFLLFGLAWIDEATTRVPLQRAQLATTISSTHASAAIRNAELIESMGMTDLIADRWFARNREGLVQSREAGLRSKSIIAISRFFRLAVQVAILGVGAWLAVNGKVTPGVMVAASIILSRALSPVEQAITVWRQLVQVRFSLQRLNAFFIAEQGTRTTLTLPVPAGRLTAEGLTYVPPRAEKPILRNVSFDIAAGECVGIIGPSGAGKTTLARLLVGVLTPTTGLVRLDAADISQWKRDELGAYVGYLPQAVQLLPGTIRDNIARMRDSDSVDDDEIIAAAKRAGVHEMILRLPEGYDTHVDERGMMLSGGQKQRIALALALFGMPRLLVLDEPNASLDADGELALMRALAVLREAGTTVVLITHKISMLNITDKLLVLRDGVAEMYGPREAVIARLSGQSKPALKAVPNQQAGKT